jgi:hypothetical protein
MSEQLTPETDAAIADGHTFSHEDLRPVIALCQRLERQRDEALKQCVELKAMREAVGKACSVIQAVSSEYDPRFFRAGRWSIQAITELKSFLKSHE